MLTSQNMKINSREVEQLICT